MGGDDDPVEGESPGSFELAGVIRDFRMEHVDFNVIPNGGFGHYAGNLAQVLDEQHLPVFTGAGFRVDEEWQNAIYQPISPHMYLNGAGVKLLAPPSIQDGAVVDSFDSSAGPYGGANVGPPPLFEPGSTMPSVSPPENLPPKIDQIVYNGGTFTISEDIHCNSLIARGEADVLISGDVTILCDQLFSVDDLASIEPLPGATLTVYVAGRGQVDDEAEVNLTTADPTRVTVYNLGGMSFELLDGGQIYARLVTPNAGLSIGDGADFYGSFIGRSLTVLDNGGFHVDAAGGCGGALDDLAGEQGLSSRGGIDSAESFSQWYTDVPGVNLSKIHMIDLVDSDGTGEYGYSSEQFFPIDDELFGNEGEDHNYFFTFTITASFAYVACAGQMIAFEGADDAWIYVEDQLGLDVGGIKPGTEQFLEMDRLDLVDGEVYTLRVFFAQRHPGASAFELKTTIILEDDGNATVSAPYD